MIQRNQPTDSSIRQRVRAVLARAWILTSAVDVGCCRGVVRLRGELRHHGTHAAQELDGNRIELLEQELRRIRGVRRVHMDLENWRRDERGEWHESTAATAGAGDESEAEEVEAASESEPVELPQIT